MKLFILLTSVDYANDYSSDHDEILVPLDKILFIRENLDLEGNRYSRIYLTGTLDITSTIDVKETMLAITKLMGELA